MDKYDDKAREIVDEVVRKHGDFYVTPTTLTTVTAILRACDEMRAAGSGDKPVAGRPVAGEWQPSKPPHNETHFQRHVGSRIVAAVETYKGVHWRCYPLDGWTDASQSGTADTVAAARDAADAWVRANGDKLDWRLPDEAQSPAAGQPARDVTAREAARLALVAINELDSIECDGEAPCMGPVERAMAALLQIIPERDKDPEHFDATALLAEYAAPSPQPAPTVDDLLAAIVDASLREGNKLAVLRRLLRTLDDEHRRRGMAAVTNGEERK